MKRSASYKSITIDVISVLRFYYTSDIKYSLSYLIICSFWAGCAKNVCKITDHFFQPLSLSTYPDIPLSISCHLSLSFSFILNCTYSFSFFSLSFLCVNVLFPSTLRNTLSMSQDFIGFYFMTSITEYHAL